MDVVTYQARCIKKRIPPHVDEGDLVGAGALGLIDAAERFDPRRNVKFATYAAARVRGAILDWIRGVDWAPRLARMRQRQRGEPVTRVGRIGRVVARNLRGEDVPLEYFLADGRAAAPPEAAAARAFWGEITRCLPSRKHRAAVTLYWRDELTMKEAGAAMGVSESYVSLILTECMEILRSRIPKDQDPQRSNEP